MYITEKSLKIINCITVIIVSIIALILILSELDRCRCRNLRPDLKMYYGSSGWITGPFNTIVACSVRDCNDLFPFPDIKSNFPEHIMLKDQWENIRDEVLNLYSEGGMGKIKGDLFFRKIADDNWKKFYIKWYDDCVDDAYEKLPFTTKLIDQIPQIQCAMISVLEPGAVITPHVGPYRTSLRYHLGLLTPQDDKCRIMVDDIKYSWRDGEDVLFDDTFVHEVRNDTDKIRIILFCDVKRILKPGIGKSISDWTCKVAKITGKNRKN